MYLESKELEDYLRRSKEQEPINKITMALVNEYNNCFSEALDIWRELKSMDSISTEGCERTVSILKRKKDLDLIRKYGKWVLETSPKIGLTLFTHDPKSSNPDMPVDMKPDDVIEYL